MRALVGLVVGMGILIVVGVSVIGITVARRMGGSPAAATIALPEPAGTRIVSIAGVADRLAMLLQGGGPDRIMVVDPRTGQVVGRVSLAP